VVAHRGPQPPTWPTGAAVFGNPKLNPETAYHATLGPLVRITHSLSLETMGFYKCMASLAVRDPSPCRSWCRRCCKKA
jgi:hypothetical protein